MLIILVSGRDVLCLDLKGVKYMCDYSLAGLENRLAKEGEELIVHRFSTGSKGLASPEYLKSQSNGRKSKMRGFFRQKALMRECAVCIPDGAKLQIKNEAELKRLLAGKREELRRLNFQVAHKESNAVREIRKLRKDIARILTSIQSRGRKDMKQASTQS